MSSPSPVVTVPNVTLTLDQLLEAIRQLDETARIQVAKALLDTELDTKLAALIRRLAERQPADDISDAMVNAEVRVIRESRASSGHA
jgi:hypothetical protein